MKIIRWLICNVLIVVICWLGAVLIDCIIRGARVADGRLCRFLLAVRVLRAFLHVFLKLASMSGIFTIKAISCTFRYLLVLTICKHIKRVRR